MLKNLDFGPYLLFSILGLKKDTPMGLDSGVSKPDQEVDLLKDKTLQVSVY